MAEIASAFVTIAPSAKGFGSKLNSEVGGSVRSSGSSLGKTFGKMFALGAGVIAAAGIGSLLKGSIDEAREAQKVGAATEAIIKATGGAARITADDVGKMAGRLSAVTGIDDEVIQQGSNLLLTFKNVKNYVDGQFVGVFDRATAAAVDLSAAGFGSVDSSSKMLGKALNDPLKGITALSRAGVTFTEQQQDQIKAMVKNGDVLGAQKVILKEVEGQVGGVAAATATSGDKARVAFGNIKESIGTALLPLIDTLARQFLRITPAIQKGIAGAGPLFKRLRAFLQPFIAGIATAVASLGSDLAPVLQTIGSAVSTFVGQIRAGTGAGGAFASVLGGLASALGSVFRFISDNQAVVATFVGIIAGAVLVAKAFAAAQLLVNLALSANPIGIVVIAIAALVAGLVYAYKNSETFRNAVNALGKGFKAVFNAIKKVVAVAVDFIRDHWRLIITILGGPVGLAVALITKHWDKIKAGAQLVIGWVKDHWPEIKALVVGPFNTAKDVIGKVWTALRQGASRVKEVVTKVFQAIESAIQKAIDKVQSFINKLAEATGKGNAHKWPQPGEASRESGRMAGRALGRSTIEGIAEGYTKTLPVVETAMKKVSKKVKEQLANIRDALSTARSDFASLVEPIASNFTGSLFEFDTASAFTANLATVKGTLQTLIGNFKKLIGEGLKPGFLYALFQEGGPALINSLAGLDAASAQSAGSLFSDVMSLSDQLGTAVAGSTDKGQALEQQTVRLEKKLDKLIDHVDRSANRTGQVINSTASSGRRRRK